MLTGGILIAVIILWPMLAAIIAYAIGRRNERARDIFVFAATVLNFIFVFILAFKYPQANLRLNGLGVLSLHFKIDGFRSTFTVLTSFLWMVATIFSHEYFSHSKNLNRYWLLNMFTFATVMGLFFSADLGTTFLFFELMSLCSYSMVAHDESSAALRAAETFLAVSIIGGLAMLMGLMLITMRTGTLELEELYKISIALEDKSVFYLPAAFLLFGFGAKAGMFPLHIWLPKAYTAAPAPASALLSGILSKTGIFGVATVSCNIFPNDYKWGAALLIFASITILLGAVLGVFSNDLKRTIACSSVSHIGFILTGVAMMCILGEHNAHAIRGTLLHILNHSLFKLVLFTAAGVVYMNKNELHLNNIRGFGRGKPLFLFVFLMGALGISGFPFFSGYVSKTLLHKSIVEGIHLYHGLSFELPLHLLEGIFILSGGLTVAYMTKLFVALFIEKSDATDFEQKLPLKKNHRYISRRSAAALALSATLIPFLGCFTTLMDTLADLGQSFFHGHDPDHAVSYFAWVNMKGVLYSLTIGAAVYFLIVRCLLMHRKKDGVKNYTDIWPLWLDLENLVYRPLLRFFVQIAVFIAGGAASLPEIPGRLLPLQNLIFNQHEKTSKKTPSLISGFSLNLLLIGAGICIILVYVFIQFLSCR